MGVDRRRRVLNFTEAAVDRLLADYAAETGYRICLKMRLRDVIDIDGLQLTSRERNFAWTSHLDFVAVDSETHLPVLAIEYDGPQHLADHQQRERDQIKDALCDRADLPLLRVDSLFTRREGKWRVLTYILWAHEMGKAYHEAQAGGLIPADEPFYHGSIIDHDDDGSLSFVGLDMKANRYLLDFRRRHNCLWEGEWWRSADGQTEVRILLALPGDWFLSSCCTIRDFAIEGISALSIAEELARAEMGWLAEQYDAGDAVAINRAQCDRILTEIDPDRSSGFQFDGSSTGWHLHAGWGAGQR